MEPGAYLSELQSQGGALLRHARTAGLDAPVPTCPGWDVRRLVQHVGRVFGRAELVVRTATTTAPDQAQIARLPDDESAFDEAEAALERLVRTLAGAGPDRPTWTFVDEGTGRSAFWFRRLAHETAVHRADAEAAAGRPISDVDAHLAVDGIDELVDVMVPFRLSIAPVALTGTVHLHCTDVDGEWLLTFADGSLSVIREHAKGDLAVRGPASELFLWGWNRRGAVDARLETFGDTALLAAWSRLTV